ncbi:hypothetical protein BH747_00260 [Enterococcus villorum]|uniref:Uncharacterized protein n=1 Tax=Enterococcus villorum TaxID=112904 RepID=A0A1V8YFC0_9ENTE|nr:hypothetical protein [Enterococcus villorum]OQO71301.1 hypothetical protein BH747_00260 [Enterococcus villorum]OQO71923.1 hypothetical protein BH744_12805 [Enterococcus villorum]
MKQLITTEAMQNDHSDSLGFKKKGFFSRLLQYITRPIKTAIKQFFVNKSIETQHIRTLEERHEQHSTINKQQKHFDPARCIHTATKSNSNKKIMNKELKIKASLSR